MKAEKRKSILTSALPVGNALLYVRNMLEMWINDYSKKVFDKIKSGEEVSALVDSSFLAMFDEPERFVAGLKKLGFTSVMEIASSTAVVTEEPDGIHGGSQIPQIYDNGKLSIRIFICM